MTLAEDSNERDHGDGPRRWSPSVGAVVDRILSVGVDGVGAFKGAEQVAAEHLASHGEPEKAIAKLIATHVRLASATGFAAGLGGLPTLPVTIPAEAVAFYVLAARCAAGVASLRGHDVASDEVRSVVLLTLLGSAGAAAVAEFGVQLGTKAAFAALRRLPGKVLIEFNKKVGFRLLTKFGEKGLINLAKAIPLIGGVVGAGVNAAAMRGVGAYAKKNFPHVRRVDATT